MYQISDDKQELARLRRLGFAERAIARFFQMRKTYGQNEMDRAALDKRRLEFARWLVATGRLTEQIS